MKILYISYDGMTDPLGRSQVIPYLIGLRRTGKEIWLISFEKKTFTLSARSEISEFLEKEGIKWFPLPYHHKPPVISTLLDIYRMRKLAFKIIEKEGISHVHCRSYISALVGLAAQKKYKTKFIFDMRGFWADERLDGGIWKLSNPLFRVIYRFFKRQEKNFLLSADAVVSLTETAKKEIHSWPGFEDVPIYVIPCCADLELFSFARIDKEILKAKKAALGISENTFVMTYLGSTGTWYMLPEMIRFFKLLLEQFPEAIFLFITQDNPSQIMNVASGILEEAQLKKIIITGASRKEVPVLASLSHVSIFFIKPLFSKKASSPTKMGELMALGIPLICNSGVGDVKEILNDGGNGIVINEFDDETFHKAIGQLNEIIKLEPSGNIACAKKYYSLEEGIKKYNGLYERI